MNKPFIVNQKGIEEFLKIGESNRDVFSSKQCPECLAESFEMGLVFDYQWNEEENGWNSFGTCKTCGKTTLGFIPFSSRKDDHG